MTVWPVMAPVMVAVSVLASAAGSGGFSFVEAVRGGLRTTHDIRLEIRRPPGFATARPASRSAVFNTRPYQVTLAGFLGRDRAILLHAERVADGSGASDYDALPPSDLPGFRVRTQCAAITAADVAEEHDLGWLAGHGWNPAGPALAIRQYFRTTPDHNQEVVISLVAKLDRCDDEKATAAALGDLRARLRVRDLDR